MYLPTTDVPACYPHIYFLKVPNLIKKYIYVHIHPNTKNQDQVFSGEQPPNSLYTEEDAPVPANVYGRTKLAFERLLQVCI